MQSDLSNLPSDRDILWLFNVSKLVDELVIFKRNERTAAVFFDFEKAFYKVWHHEIIAKRLQMNIPIYFVDLVKSFLVNRNFRVHVVDSFSTPHSIPAGIPQVSYIFSTRSTTHINGIPFSVNKPNLLTVHTMFSCTSLWKWYAVQLIQEHLTEISKWLKEWRITMKLNKTVAILLRDKSTSNWEKNGPQNHLEYSVKYLWVTLKCRLTFSKHITNSYKFPNSRGIIAAVYPMFNEFSHLRVRGKLTIVKIYPTTLYILMPVLHEELWSWIVTGKSRKPPRTWWSWRLLEHRGTSMMKRAQKIPKCQVNVERVLNNRYALHDSKNHRIDRHVPIVYKRDGRTETFRPGKTAEII